MMKSLLALSLLMMASIALAADDPLAFAPPFQVVVEDLNATGNVLEVEVTNLSANRIRDLDRRGVKWRYFYDINFISLGKAFDASNWPLADSGLLGPVTRCVVLESRIE